MRVNFSTIFVTHLFGVHNPVSPSTIECKLNSRLDFLFSKTDEWKEAKNYRSIACFLTFVQINIYSCTLTYCCHRGAVIPNNYFTPLSLLRTAAANFVRRIFGNLPYPASLRSKAKVVGAWWRLERSVEIRVFCYATSRTYVCQELLTIYSTSVYF